MKIIYSYLARQACLGLLIATAALLPVFSFFDLQEQLDDVGQGAYRTRDAFMYTIMMLPRRFIQIVPFVALLGNVAALGRLAVTQELISMRAAGLSPIRISRAPLAVGVILLIATVLLDEFVASSLHQQAIANRNAALGAGAELGQDLGIWTRDKQQILRIGEMQHSTRAADVEIMQLDDDGFLRRDIRAAYADMVSNDEWLLGSVTVRIIDGERITLEHLDTMTWTPFLPPQEISRLTKPPESLSPTELFHHVQFLQETGQQAKPYALALWRKAGLIFTTVAMLLLAIPFVFGSVRAGMGNRLILAAVTGIGVYLLEQIVANAGLVLNTNPAATALLPGLALIAIANSWLRRIF